ncbi:Zn(2)-C6 fungal-type domain-containing protein [Mycena chlorophos]|uniref:Zn(2)-C6 fungal-type domain-containing protein n=1 Tax=Mycena chlorophos TaxID=658473 RepID=A0A8H6W880_MYCCL|nr:Zn(2)-C6 fungal-type domain-containing protein [Mycena chlorophos]
MDQDTSVANKEAGDGQATQRSAAPSSATNINAVLRPRPKREQKACDECRRRRRACDGTRVPLKACSTCIEAQVECGFTGAPRKQNKYIEGLEAKLKANEELLQAQALADLEKSSTRSSSSDTGSPRTASTGRTTPESSPLSPKLSGRLGAIIEVISRQIRASNDPHPVRPANLEVLDHATISAIDIANGKRFRVNSGRCGMVATALEQREEYEGRPLRWANRRAPYWTQDPTPHSRMPPPGTLPLVFPPRDLLYSLFKLYFRHTNIYYPVLHLPTFMRSVVDGLHLRDRSFGNVVLMVCALGAKFSTDPRVLYRKEGDKDELELNVGMQYFDQIQFAMEYLFTAPTLTHIQLCALGGIFTQFSVLSQTTTLIAMGIKIAQDRGVHRWGAMPTVPPALAEQWKRAFWCLYCIDRQEILASGQPVAIEGFDIDTEFPVECDDEYWPGESGVGPGEPPFTQPSDKPSYMAYFLQVLKLNQLQGLVLRGLYSLPKNKEIFAIRDDRWQEEIVTELDSALDAWLAGLPVHLRWDNFEHLAREAAGDSLTPAEEQEVFFDQSVLLHAAYHALEIYIHRQFVPEVTKNALNYTLPSTAICTTAARATTRILRVHQQRRKGLPSPELTPFAFTSALVFIVNVWSASCITGAWSAVVDGDSTMDDICLLMEVIRLCEHRWILTGLFYDLLSELAAPPESPLVASRAKATASKSKTDECRNTEPVPSASATSRKRTRAATRNPGAGSSSSTPESNPQMAIPALDTFDNESQSWEEARRRQLQQHRQQPRLQAPLPRPLPRPPKVASQSYEEQLVENWRLNMYVRGSDDAMQDVRPTSTSSWYPGQVSAAPFGFPDFAAGQRPVG